MIWFSFYRPKECFRGAFNNFAAWWTNGAFCHCELVIEGTSEFIFEHVQKTYVAHMKNRDPRSKAIVQELERSVMDKHGRRLIHRHGRGWISFSLLFGDQLRVRVLDIESTDAWHQTPQQKNDVVVWKSVDLGEDGTTHIFNWALEEVGKPYNNMGALFSWLPSPFHDSVNVPKHFCSEFCVRALQRAGQLNALNASHTTPNKLYDALQKFVPTYTPETTEAVGLDVDVMVAHEAAIDSLEAMMVDTSDEEEEDSVDVLSEKKETCPM